MADTMTTMNLTAHHYRELIKAALNERPGWVPLGPMEAAKRRKLTGPYSRPNILADLERDGLITLTNGKNTATIRLTEAGQQAIQAMPDDLHADWFPLPADIAKAKARLG